MSGAFSEQLKLVNSKFFGARPKLLPVCHVRANIEVTDIKEDIREARYRVLEWLSKPKRAGKLPDIAWRQGDFEADLPGFRLGAVHIEAATVDYWICRFEHIDSNPSISRSWSTEITVARNQDQLAFGLRQVLSTREDQPNFKVMLPNVIHKLAETPGMRFIDGRKILARPWILDDGADVKDLVLLIQNRKRTYPLFVVSLSENETDPARAVIDAFELSRRCIGIAQVVVVPGPLTRALSDEVGKEFSVFNGAVRTYKAGCDINIDSPYSHPLFFAERMRSWKTRSGHDFLEFLMEEAAAGSASNIDTDKDFPNFSKVKQAALAHKLTESRKDGGAQSEELALLRAENEALRDDAEAATSLALGEEMARLKAEGWARELEEDNARLRWKIRVLTEEIESNEGRNIDSNVPIPDSLNCLRQWAEEHLAGRVVVTPKAARAAKKSVFKDVEFAFQSVLLLANEYWQMKAKGGGQEFTALFNEKLKSMNLKNEPSGEESRLKEQGDEFFVDWDRGKRLLDWHLKTPSSVRCPERCFRLYYFWDDKTQQVIIGSMPGHLETRLT